MVDEHPQPAAAFLEALRSVLTQVAEPSQLLKTILGQAVARTAADRGLFAEVARGGQLAFRVLYRYDRELLSGQAGQFSRSVFAEAMSQRRAVRLSNAMADKRFTSQESVQDLRLTSVLCMPILIDGQVAALVHLESNRTSHFQDHHEALLASLLELAAPALAALRASEGALNERDSLRQSQEELQQSRQFLAEEWSFGRFVGKSPAVRTLSETVRKAARSDFPVLLTGETGTGKGILARVVHHASPRGKHAFVTVFCPSLEKGLVETELFGNRRGAFTGAVTDRLGKIQAADQGTLFLDEIGELPMEIQPKLLRLLQEKTYERVGEHTERQSATRIVAATNRDLEHEVASGRFRRDLLERLNFLPLRIPPLRERREDIPLLLRHCLDHHDAGRWVELTAEASEFLTRLEFAWPGNVRHLEHLAARLAVEEIREPVTIPDLRRLLDAGAAAGSAADAGHVVDLEAGLPALLAQTEKSMIEQTLRRHPGLSRVELADKLKIGESTLYKKLRIYGIEM